MFGISWPMLDNIWGLSKRKVYWKNIQKPKQLYLKLAISIDLFPGPVISRKSG
jgi:hypothetical protein